MKFEFVEFYPVTDKNRGNLCKKAIGTVHIYCIDCGIDIRGIRVSRAGRGLYFHMPHVISYDHETGEKVRYPVFRFTNQKVHMELLDFLRKFVSIAISERIKELNAAKLSKKQA